MKLYQAAALAVLLSTTAASACETLNVGAEAVAFGMMRGQPRLDGKPLWKLGNGVKVVFCGETRTDARGIEWLWVTTRWQEEPWDHNGWISSRIVERNVPTITSNMPTVTPRNVPDDEASADDWEPHSTMPTRPVDPWTAAVEAAIKISARQNNGRPSHTHFCEPEHKVCSDMVAYKNGAGKQFFLLIHTAPNGDVTERMTCELNDTLDVRTCTDFDTKAKWTDMRGTDGDWKRIAESETY